MEEIGIIGIGKLGLCFALNLEQSGFKVYGIDITPQYINQLKNKVYSSSEPLVNAYLIQAQNFFPSDNISILFEKNITDIFIMVATPSTKDGGYDHSQIERVTDELIQFGKQNETKNLYIGCTTMPGYCNQLAQKMRPYNYTVSYNPEFIAQGAIIKNQQYPDQVLIGEANDEAGNRLQYIHSKMTKNNPVYCRMDCLSAEITKLATNCFLTTKISFANAIGDLAIKTGADQAKILSAIGADSRIGNKYLNHGFGFGGPCFPRDNRALDKFAKQNDFPLLISEATDAVNKQHFQFLLDAYLNKYKEGEIVEFDGVSYKKGSTLIDESQQLSLAIALAKNNRSVVIKDNKEVIEQVKSTCIGIPFTFIEV
ncbi:MAG TPA: nucleotide sugar dehydrogenase [Arachidicoccus sp.]